MASPDTASDPTSSRSDPGNNGDGIFEEELQVRDELGDENEVNGEDSWEDIVQLNYIETDLADVEDLRNYCPGGFHPVDYGTVFDGRFEVISKLGHGGFATVWLCLDHGPDSSDGVDEPHRQKWRAVKIIRADQSPTEAEEWPPLRLKQYLESTLGLSQADWEANHVTLPLEHFWLEGPNGWHLCEVSTVQGSSIAECWEARMPADRPALLKHLLYGAGEALRFLHGYGICHGDFTPGNVLLRADEAALEKISRSEMLALLEERGTANVETINASGEVDGPGPHAPICVYEPADLSNLPLLNDNVAVVDFGGCFWGSEEDGGGPPEWSPVPPEFAAPEALFNCGVGPASDVWAFACTIIMCLMRTVLFASDRHRAAAWYEATLGEPLPKEFLQARIKELRKQLEDERSMISDEARLWTEGEVERLETGKEEVDEEAREHVTKAIAETGHDDPILAQISRERVYNDYERDANGEVTPAQKTVDIVQRIPEEEARLLADLLSKVFKWYPKDRLDIDAVLAHEFFADRMKPAIDLKPTQYYLMKAASEFHDNPREDVESGYSTPLVEEPSDNEGETSQVQSNSGGSSGLGHPQSTGSPSKSVSGEETVGQESAKEQESAPTPKSRWASASTRGLPPAIYTIGKFLDDAQSYFINKWSTFRGWEPTADDILQILLGILVGIILWALFAFILSPAVHAWLLSRYQQQQCPSRNTLLIPMTLKSSTSTYSRGFLAFSAPKIPGDTNATCTCIAAQGFSHQ